MATSNNTSTEPRFNYQEIDEQVNLPDLRSWVDNNEMSAIVDEDKGGIIGYISTSHVDEITNRLNEYDTLKAENEMLKRDMDLNMRLAFEFGYKQCEKGNNIQMAFENYSKLTNSK